MAAVDLASHRIQLDLNPPSPEYVKLQREVLADRAREQIHQAEFQEDPTHEALHIP
jgi:hypothetical protein